MEILEKIAYLKGLADGMNLKDEKSKESKLLVQMLDLLEDMALEMQDMQDEQADLEEGLDAVSDDLADVESYIYEAESDEDDEDCCCCDDEDCCCGEDEEDECYETVCPTCEEHVYFDDSVLEEGSVTCPNCGEKLEFDLSGMDDCCCGDEDEQE